MLRCGLVVEHLAEPWEHTPAVTWVHWPEAMFGWREPTQAEVERFEQWIEACASRGLLLWTVHNAFPHGWRGSRRFGHVYRLVAERAHVHLHHGHQSIREITRRYPSARPRISRTYPHGGCWHLVGDLTPDAARARLALRTRDRILLVFGEVRTPRELLLAWHAARATGWHVLLVGRLPSRRRLWRLTARLARSLPTRRWTIIVKWVPDNEIDAYLKAADAVLIPRYDALNSGNVFLGFTFGKPVVGPRIGNIGEVLTATGNPTFDPTRPRSIVRALSDLDSAQMAALGRMNAAWLARNGQWDQAAAVVCEVIEEALGRPRR
jgi:glycosyltransferase involved in cell wall biosynthesis